MSDDNLMNKYKKDRDKKRTKVQKTDTLLDGISKEETSHNHDHPLTAEEIERKLESYPKTKRRSGIVIDEQLTKDILNFCRSHNITIEVFLEASWILLQDNSSLLNDVAKEAQLRLSRRKEAGKLRRMLTMLKGSKS